MKEHIHNPLVRAALVLAVVALSSGCVDPDVPRYQLTPTTPSPNPSPAPTPAPGPAPAPTPPALTVGLAVGPSNPLAGTSVAFTASTNTIRTQPTLYVWAFGDGAVEVTSSSVPLYASMFHTFGRAGAYDARVDVTDGEGRSAYAIAHVTVLSPPPSPPVPEPPPAPAPTLSAALTCTPGTHSTTTTACNVTASYGGTTLLGAKITNVDWDWSDGTITDNHSTTPINTHQYTVPGNFTVFANVTATTADGAKTTMTSKSVVVP